MRYRRGIWDKRERERSRACSSVVASSSSPGCSRSPQHGSPTTPASSTRPSKAPARLCLRAPSTAAAPDHCRRLALRRLVQHRSGTRHAQRLGPLGPQAEERLVRRPERRYAGRRRPGRPPQRARRGVRSSSSASPSLRRRALTLSCCHAASLSGPRQACAAHGSTVEGRARPRSSRSTRSRGLERATPRCAPLSLCLSLSSSS